MIPRTPFVFPADKWLLAGAVVLLAALRTGAATPATNTSLRVMTANLNGNTQSYQPFAIRIFQGLKPDIVAIQEFNYSNNTPADFRALVDTAFGPDFAYYREPYTNNGNIPNGIISRYPIAASGSWPDTVQSQPNRGYAWAQISLPGTNSLYVVSAHLLTSSSIARASEASNLQALIQANFPSNAWVVLAGDFNPGSRAEPAMVTFDSFLSDFPVPTDAEVGGNPDTSMNRNAPHDYVLPSFTLTNMGTATVFASHSFPNGLVFDSRVYTPLTDVAPIQFGDSSNAQHMAVIKDFLLSTTPTTNHGNAPAEIIAQWNFNNTNVSLISPPPTIGSGTLTLAGGTTAAWVSGSGSSDSGDTNSAWNTTSYPAATLSNKTAGIQFSVSTAGRQNISVRWDERVSNTGSKYVRLQCATNGTTFVDYPTATAMTAATVFEPKTNLLAGLAGIDNNPNVAFRIVAEFENSAADTSHTNYVGAGGTYGTAGTVRFDMLTVIGTSLVTNLAAGPATLGVPTLVDGNQFQLTVTGTAGLSYVVEASTELRTWFPMQTNVSPFQFLDSNAVAYPRRFFRAVALP